MANFEKFLASALGSNRASLASPPFFSAGCWRLGKKAPESTLMAFLPSIVSTQWIFRQSGKKKIWLKIVGDLTDVK